MEFCEQTSFTGDMPKDVERAMARLAAMIEDPPDREDLWSAVRQRLLSQEEKDGLSVIGPSGDTYWVFDTGFGFRYSQERILGCLFYDKKVNSVSYSSLDFARESVLRSRLRAEPHIGDMVFADREEENSLLLKVALRAISEEWRFVDRSNEEGLPILKHYLEQRYHQAVCEDQLRYDDSGRYILWNTGLLDGTFRAVYLLSEAEEEAPSALLFSRTLVRTRVWQPGDAWPEVVFDDLPLAAQFEVQPGEGADVEESWRFGGVRLKDCGWFADVIAQVNHSLSPRWIPFASDDAEGCRQAFLAAIQDFFAMARAGYVSVVPQYDADTGTVQWLMPIYLEGLCERSRGERREWVLPNGALCLTRDEKGDYVGTSWLTLDAAYRHARVLGRVNSFWLDPVRIGIRISNRRFFRPSMELPADPLAEGEEELALFTYATPFISRTNGNNHIIGLFGRIGDDEALLHISSLFDGTVSQEQMQKLVSVCEEGPILVRKVSRNAKGWNLSLVGVTPDFFDLIGEKRPISVTASALPAERKQGVITEAQEFSHYQAETEAYVTEVDRGTITGDDGCLYRVSKSDIAKTEGFLVGQRVEFEEKVNINPNAPSGMRYAQNIVPIKEH